MSVRKSQGFPKKTTKGDGFSMKSFRFRLLLATGAVLIGTAFGNSQTADTPAAPPPPAPPHHFHRAHARGAWGPGSGFFASYLNLTDEQKTQMKTIMQKEHGTMKPLMQQIQATRQQIHQLEEGNFDEAKVRALASQQSQTQVEITVAQARIHSEMFQVLTADQQAKMKEFEANRQAHRQQRMQQHAAPPAQPDGGEQQ